MPLHQGQGGWVSSKAVTFFATGLLEVDDDFPCDSLVALGKAPPSIHVGISAVRTARQSDK